MSTIIAPTCGRVVLFRAGSQELADGSITINDLQQPMPALVTFVHSDGTINLAVFDHAGRQFSRNSVLLVQDGDTIPREILKNGDGEDYEAVARHAYWMPYQIGQAAKAAEAPAPVATPAPSPAPTQAPAAAA